MLHSPPLEVVALVTVQVVKTLVVVLKPHLKDGVVWEGACVPFCVIVLPGIQNLARNARSNHNLRFPGTLAGINEVGHYHSHLQVPDKVVNLS